MSALWRTQFATVTFRVDGVLEAEIKSEVDYTDHVT